ncbi:jg10646 [Pararge aegeria aegeria]|uniref:Jg10646 protein n=2 Tax=Pararge aegeria TaxID=116150 RepID=A0A8S4RSV9_9NEOP|nr:jg10646 [Pararge aegeria aegeria]
MDVSLSLQVLIIIAVLWNNEVTPAPRQKRLSLASQMPSYYFTNIDGHPGTYSFGYNVLDPETGNNQYRSEEKYPNGTVVGSYGYIDPRGKSRRIDYIADGKGYRIMNEAPRRQNYIEESTKDISSTETLVSWTRPRKPNKKKVEKIIKRPSEVLQPPY